MDGIKTDTSSNFNFMSCAKRNHPHLQFTIETSNASGYLVFLGFETSKRTGE